MRVHTRFALFLLSSLFVLLIPISASAGLIRVNFDITDSQYTAFGLGYMEFEDDIALGASTPISSLTDLDWSIGVSWIDHAGGHFVFDIENEGRWSGDVIIDRISSNEYSASFSSSAFYTFTGNSTFPGGWIQLYNGGSFIAENNFDLISGNYQTSVWFDNTSSTPVPSSFLLLIFALLPLVGLKRRLNEN